MANENALQTRSFDAGADLSADQYCFVKIATGQLALASAGGADAIGILQDKPNAAGHAGCVAYGGTSKVIAGGTFSAGGDLSCDSSGHAIAAVAGDTILGKATADGASGKMSAILINRGAAIPAS